LPTPFASPAVEAPVLAESSAEELKSHAAELMAQAHEAEQAAKMMRVKARAPWRRGQASEAELYGASQNSNPTESPVMAMPWMPVYFMPVSVPTSIDAVPHMAPLLARKYRTIR